MLDIVIDLMERIITCFATGYRQLVAGDNGLIFISFLLGIYVLRYKINPTIGIHSGGDQPERLVRFATDRHRPAGCTRCVRNLQTRARVLHRG